MPVVALSWERLLNKQHLVKKERWEKKQHLDSNSQHCLSGPRNTRLNIMTRRIAEENGSQQRWEWRPRGGGTVAKPAYLTDK